MNPEHFPHFMADYFNLRWIIEDLWELDLPILEAKISQFVWHLEFPFWASSPPDLIFDLSPQQVLNAPSQYPEHIERISTAAVQFPIETALFGNRLVILDGIHRLVNKIQAGHTHIQYRVIPQESLTRSNNPIPLSGFAK